MGKHATSVPNSCIPNQTSNPNHKWVRMFNVLDHHRWNNVKKMLTTNKKHVEDKQVTGLEGNPCHGGPTSTSHVDPAGVVNLPANEEKTKESSTSSIKGRAAKLKAMITKDMITRKKGKHRRSSTCPGGTELGGDHHGPNHNRFPSVGGKQGHPPTSSNPSHPSIVRESNGNFYPKEYEYLFARIGKKCHLCRTHRPAGHTHSADSKEQLGGDDLNNLVQENKNNEPQILDGEPSKVNQLMNTSRPFYRSATFHQSKELLDAMDLLSLNKDFFLKVLEDPESSLSQHFMAQQASGMRKRLDKSGTFPRPSSSPNKRGSSPSTVLMRQRKLSFKENNQNLNTSSLNNLYDNQQGSGGTHFKDLRQKIKHVIRESKKERLRVAMDAVLHKVPYGPQYFENGRDVSNQLKSDMDKEEDRFANNNFSASSLKKEKWKVARSSSFHESMERYNKLFEISFQRELKEPTTLDNLKLKRDEETQNPARTRRVLARISSSPNLGRFPHKDSNPLSLHHTIDFPPRIQSAKDENKNVNEHNAKVLPPPSLDQDKNEDKPLLEVVPDHDPGVTMLVSSDEKTSLMVHDSDCGNKGKVEKATSRDNDDIGFTGTPMERIEQDSTSQENSLEGTHKSGDDFVDQQDGTCSDMVHSKEDYSFQLYYGSSLDSIEDNQQGTIFKLVDYEKTKEDSSTQQETSMNLVEYSNKTEEDFSCQPLETSCALADFVKAEDGSSNQQNSTSSFHLVDFENDIDDSFSQQHGGIRFNWVDFDPKAEEVSSNAQLRSSPLDLEEKLGMDEDHSSNLQCGTDIVIVDYADKDEDKEDEGGRSPSGYFQVQVDSKDQADFNYVKDILHLSGYSGSQVLGTWSSSEQPVDPSLFTEVESWTTLQEPHQFFKHDHEETISRRCNHLLLFDLINEVLLETYERSVTYWSSPLTNCSWIHPMPKGHHVLEEVWANISWYLGSRQEDPNMSLDYLSMRDLAKDDKWMNLQLEAEYVALELEGLIFEDLLEEFGYS